MSSSYQIIRPSVKPRFTLFIPWTRYEYADKMLDNINSLYLPRQDMEVVFYIDTDNKQLWQRLNSWAILNQFVYNGVKLVKSGNPAPVNYSPIPRRQRIVAMKENSKEYIEASELVFGIEDDTRVPVNAFELMFDQFRNPAKKVGFVQGVQQGRWQLPILGAWRLDDVDNPTEITTLTFEHQTDVVEIDGGGMFCYMTLAKLYKKHRYYYWAAEPGGPDVTYGFELRKQGYKCLMDFRLICDHYTDQGILVPTPQNTLVLKWVKGGERWIRQDPVS